MPRGDDVHVPQVIPVYSISKPFLAQAVLELAVPLHRHIGAFLPHLQPVYAQRTLASLLNHTSGLADYTQIPDYRAAVQAGESAWSRERLLQHCEGLRHDLSGFNYSNIGYLLLRMLLESQTGLEYFEALTKLVFTPLSIRGFQEWQAALNIVPGYDPGWVYSGTFLADTSTIGDAVARLGRYRAATQGLSAGLVSVDHRDTGFDSPGYNFGFMTDGGSASQSPTLIGHGGSGPGWRLIALADTNTWLAACEYSDGEFDQTMAIGRLRETLRLRARPTE